MTNRRKDHPEPLHVGSGRVGLAVMRMQPPHRGHMNLLTRMRQDCDTVIVAFGSTQLSRVVRNPFTFEQRVEMLRAVYGDTFKPLPLVDIDSQGSSDDWVDYVLDKIRKLNLPAPTDYYTGSPQDAKWYTSRFAGLADPVDELGMTRSYRCPSRGTRLHIVDRVLHGLPPAEEIRSLIERRDPEWHRYVPARIVDYIEWTYPPELRMALAGTELPDPHSLPDGTRFKIGADLFCLHDDAKWRPLIRQER